MPQINRRGRPPTTTRDEVARVALRRFATDGFDATTLDDVAAELGLGRRTLFRYFPSKNDMVWGDFDWVLERLRAAFDASDPDAPMMSVLREAVVASNTYPDAQLPELRLRMTLITTVPALQAHSMLRYAEWRAVVAEFAARRLRCQPDDLAPVAVGHAALAASTSAFTHWVAHPDRDIVDLLRSVYTMLEQGFDVTTRPPPPSRAPAPPPT